MTDTGGPESPSRHTCQQARRPAGTSHHPPPLPPFPLSPLANHSLSSLPTPHRHSFLGLARPTAAAAARATGTLARPPLSRQLCQSGRCGWPALPTHRCKAPPRRGDQTLREPRHPDLLTPPPFAVTDRVPFVWAPLGRPHRGYGAIRTAAHVALLPTTGVLVALSSSSSTAPRPC